MKKFLFLVITFIMIISIVQAKVTKRDFNSIISESNINKNFIAISIKDYDTGKVIFEQNEKTLMHPASVQKLLTIIPALEVLGDDYLFSTKLYSRGEDSYIIKLGADPYLTTNDLETLVESIDKSKIKKIFLDDSIIEKKDWGEGWQWDDDLNTYMPKFNAYNLDQNLIKITVVPDNKGTGTFIINQNKYPMVFFNNVIVGNDNNVKITRDNSISYNSLTIDGTINHPVIMTIPTDNLARYFIVKLTKALNDKEIYLKNSPTVALISLNDKKVQEISHPISFAIEDILKNSNNMVAETLVKLAAAKKYNTTGSDTLGIKLFDEYCEKIGINNSEVRLVDASGVSKNNIVNADFVTEYLYKNKNNKILQKMAFPTVGTLSTRMILLKNNLRAKTGTLSDVSSIAGFITTKSNKQYIFCIMINDPKSKESEKKLLEDYLIRELFLRG